MRFEEFNICTFCETSICRFLTNRKSPYLPLANKSEASCEFGRVRLNKIKVARIFVSGSSRVLT